ncbi:MAG: hypothetical protein JXQ71_17840 [Verrucomicrobia bacterium]|nr:hypothetical protein [Verrucomicrobiota bacterium]
MKSFDDKWQECAAHARRAEPPAGQAPFGFAARVAARALRSESGSSESVWLRFAVRCLAGVLVLLAVCAVLELPHLAGAHPLAPGIENAVAALVWTL